MPIVAGSSISDSSIFWLCLGKAFKEYCKPADDNMRFYTIQRKLNENENYKQKLLFHFSSFGALKNHAVNY